MRTFPSQQCGQMFGEGSPSQLRTASSRSFRLLSHFMVKLDILVSHFFVAGSVYVVRTLLHLINAASRSSVEKVNICLPWIWLKAVYASTPQVYKKHGLNSRWQWQIGREMTLKVWWSRHSRYDKWVKARTSRSYINHDIVIYSCCLSGVWLKTSKNVFSN